MAGAGAWSNPKNYRMVSPALGKEGGRVQYAVESVQRALEIHELKPGSHDGIFGPKTREAVRAFQLDRKMQPDGIVGPKTTRALFRPFVDDAERKLAIPDHLLHGQVTLESGYDPGAEGKVDSRDRGLCQVSSKWFPEITDEQAYGRPRFIINWSAKRLRDAYDGLKSWDAAILHHNLPAAAQELARTGEITNTTEDPERKERSLRYIALVRRVAGT